MSDIEAKKEKMISKKYLSSEIEKKWQAIWEESGIYEPDMVNAKRPFYNLMMFPYPSAEGLHVGGIFTFGGVDAYGRFKRMQGYDVFEPIGLDGFGIHAENHAIKTNSHPLEHAKRTEDNYYRQLHETGIGFAWKHSLETYDPHYYKWTQWLFTELFKAGLAYRKKAKVNFCPWCKTVLSDEQVLQRIKPSAGAQAKWKQESSITGKEEEVAVGVCERCDTVVEKRDLEQWFFGITKYADRLLANLDNLDWTEKVKTAQKNWIGKKEGINIKYQISNVKYQISNEYVEIFTTRPDTNFGATFIALAPEHLLVDRIKNNELGITDEQRNKVVAYVDKTKSKSEIERQSENREKTGVFTGLYAINPLTNYLMPIWVSDFVLGGFGTGALVGVPGHDLRDFAFAQKFGLEIKRVVVGADGDRSPITRIEQVQEENGTMIDSEFLNGMDIHAATQKIMSYIEEKGWGKRVSTYHLRDWLISRQRYWGPPIPMIYCEQCAKRGQGYFDTAEAEEYQNRISNFQFPISNFESDKNSSHAMAGWYPVEEKDLPVVLPFVEDYKPLGMGKSPLASVPEFVEVKCPVCGNKAERETDVSDVFLDSAWYFFRYISNERDDVAFDKDLAKKWLPVSMYIGGAEHSVLHLLYARFTTMVLHDLGYIPFEEPFKRFYAHGLLIKDGSKMSKSKGNVINPDEYVAKFGADTLRSYLLFLGPFSEGGDFRDSGIEGMNRFLKRVWKLLQKEFPISNFQFPISNEGEKNGDNLDRERLKMMHGAIKGMTEDMEGLRFNTAISKLMIYYNFLAKQEILHRDEVRVYLQLLAPFAPHMAEELWENLEIKDQSSDWSVHQSEWPGFDEAFLVEEMATIVVQVNGKVRGVIKVQGSRFRAQGLVEDLAKKNESVGKFLEGKRVLKVIYVPGKILNFVIS